MKTVRTLACTAVAASAIIAGAATALAATQIFDVWREVRALNQNQRLRPCHGIVVVKWPIIVLDRPTIESHRKLPTPRHLWRLGQSLGSDIDYTLRAFPNHYRALDAMMRLAVRDRTPQPEGATYTVNCYFDRAVRFRPHDGVVRLMFGLFYYRNGDLKNAIVQGSLGDELTPNNPNIKYNLGLFYFQAKEYEKALSYAQQAQLLGTKLPGLKRKLVKIGKWLEPVAVTGKPPAPTIDQATASTDSAGVRAKSAAEPAKASVPADAAAGLPAQSAKGAAGAPPPSASR